MKGIMYQSFLRRFTLGLAVASILMSSGFTAKAAISVQTVPRLSQSLLPEGDSGGATLSADGRLIVFTSSAANLVTNSHRGLALDVYVRDRQTGLITLVSTSVDGRTGGDNHSSGPSLSADGRWVAFESRAQNLVTNRTLGVGDIYIRDLVGGVTRLVSVNPSGAGGNGPSAGASITPDGRFVVFESAASDLVTNDSNGATDVFVRDLKTGPTTLVSLNWQGTASAATLPSLLDASTDPVITPDGRYVAFQSLATNLINPGSRTNYLQVYVRDLERATNILVSVTSTGQPAAGDSTNPQISADGRYIVYLNQSTVLINSARFEPTVVFRRDLLTGTTLDVSLTAQQDDGSQPAMSDDGTVVSFVRTNQIYLWHENGGFAALVSTNASGQPSQGHAASPVVSGDGQMLVFLSDATDLARDATNGQFQVFARDLAGATNQLASVTAGTGASSTDCLFPTVSGHGRVLAFQAFDGSLGQGQSSGVVNVFDRDLTTTHLDWVSEGYPGLPPVADQGTHLAPNGLSADGRYVLFTSAANDLTRNHTNGVEAVFVWDTQSGTNTLVSVNQAGSASDIGSSRMPAMTPDGRFVAFISSAPDLVANDTNNLDDVFVRDLVSGSTSLASVRPAGQEKLPLYLTPPVVSADGRYVAYGLNGGYADLYGYSPIYNLYELVLRDRQTAATTIVTNALNFDVSRLRPLGITGSGLWYLSATFPDLSFGTYLYRYDVQSGANERISDSSIYTFTLTIPAFTPDGRFAVAQTLGGGHLTNDIWRYDSVAKTFQTLALANGGTTYPDARSRLSVSADGRYTVFVTPDDGLSPVDKNRGNDVYVADAMQPGVLLLVSVNAAGTASGNGSSDSPSIGGDGRFVAFRSGATDLVPGVTNGPNLYIRDLQAGVTTLISSKASDSLPQLTLESTVAAFETTVDGYSLRWPDVSTYHITRAPLFRLTILPFGANQPPSLVWTAEMGKNYGVQFKNLLTDPNWQALSGTPIPYQTNELLLQDTNLNRGSQRFYRAVVQP